MKLSFLPDSGFSIFRLSSIYLSQWMGIQGNYTDDTVIIIKFLSSVCVCCLSRGDPADSKCGQSVCPSLHLHCSMSELKGLWWLSLLLNLRIDALTKRHWLALGDLSIWCTRKTEIWVWPYFLAIVTLSKSENFVTLYPRLGNFCHAKPRLGNFFTR